MKSKLFPMHGLEYIQIVKIRYEMASFLSFTTLGKLEEDHLIHQTTRWKGHDDYISREHPGKHTLGRFMGALCPTNLPIGWISKTPLMMHSSEEEKTWRSSRHYPETEADCYPTILMTSELSPTLVAIVCCLPPQRNVHFLP